jgi:hypothetical protein
MKYLILLAGAFVVSQSLAGVPTPPPQLCADENCKSAIVPGQGAVKWHPGHYMLIFRDSSHDAVMNRYIPEICKESALQGLQLKLNWNQLEKGEGEYDFSRVDDMYDALASCGKYLVLQVQVGDFTTSDPSVFAPSYLLTNPAYDGGVARTKNGYIARIWEEPVMDRKIALSKALAARYDNRPYFEGIILAETATSQVQDGYGFSGTAYITELKRAITEMVASWKSTNVIVFSNYMQDTSDAQFIDFVKFLRANRSTVGGPDTLPPPHSSTLGERVYRGELGGVDMRGQMPAMFAVQTPELGGKEGTFTPKQLYDHCVNTNRCSHMFWIRNMSNGGAEQKWDTGILPYLRTGPKTNRNCPANYKGCVD